MDILKSRMSTIYDYYLTPEQRNEFDCWKNDPHYDLEFNDFSSYKQLIEYQHIVWDLVSLKKDSEALKGIQNTLKLFINMFKG